MSHSTTTGSITVHECKKMYIAGEWQDVAGGKTYDVFNPATGELAGRAVASTFDTVHAAVTAAHRTFPDWSSSDKKQRIKLIRKLNGLMQQHKHELSRLIKAEMGAPELFALKEQVETPIAIIDNYIELMEQVEPDKRVGNSLIVKEPVGVVAAIVPWNYPLQQLVLKVIPALATGCTVVAKPSEITPFSTFRFTELIHAAGFPKGCFNLVNGTGKEVGNALSSHPDVDMVSFTGSLRAGSQVAANAAATVKRVALELGGKSPSVVTEDADLEAAVRYTTGYCMTNTGQCCNSWTRLIVPETLLKQAEEIAADEAGELEPTLGPLISEAQYRQVQDYIRTGQDEGARLITGGLGYPEWRTCGHYARATVFSNVTANMTIAQEEVFGPVLVIQAYENLEEAVYMANDTSYGLHAGVWAGTRDQALAIARQLRAGQVDLNGAAFNLSAPFGGYKKSGYGREYGRYGLDEFYETKAIQI